MTGPELTHARNQLRLTQSQLAELLCVTLRTIQRYERADKIPKAVDWALIEIAYASRGQMLLQTTLKEIEDKAK